MSYDFYSDFDGYEMMDEQYPYQDDFDENYDGSVGDLIEHCIIPTLNDTYPNVLKLFIFCLLFRIGAFLSQLNRSVYPASSMACGLCVLHIFFHSKSFHVVTMALVGYLLVRILPRSWKSYKAYIIGVFLLIYLFLGEFVIVKYEAWETIRGTQMVMAMKILSYTFDLRSGIVKDTNALDYFGYCLCPATIIFGPWVSFSDYKNSRFNDDISCQWFVKILQSLILSILFFMASVCVLEWVINDESSIIWLIYRNAMLYRVGHYFVSFVSEVSLLISGFGNKDWDVSVTRPLSIELPYSLVQVVVNWNIPMHRWLKTYVFKTSLPLGGFSAIMITYLVSALLHGFNIRLAAVLLSLGVYTYVEHSLRSHLSSVFNACISSKPCPSHCSRHKRTTKNLLVHLVNVIFMLIAIFHLAYLGILINVDNTKYTTFEKAFREWIKLKFISHWVVLGTFIAYIFIYLLS